MILVEDNHNEFAEFTDSASFIDQLGYGIFSLDPAGYLTGYNKTAAKIFGISESESGEHNQVSNFDIFLKSGLSEVIKNGITPGKKWQIDNHRCTNRNGRFMVLDISCCVDQNEPESIRGVIHEKNNIHHPEASQTEKLKLLTEVSAAIVSSFELNQVLRVIMTAATAAQGLSFNRVFLFMYDQVSNTLRGHLAVGPENSEEADKIWSSLAFTKQSLTDLIIDSPSLTPGALTSMLRKLVIVPTTPSLVNTAVNQQQWVNINEQTEVDPTTAKIFNHLSTDKMALVPLISKNKTIGLLAADNVFSKKPIDDDCVRLLQILANQAALAIEKAQLYAQQKRRTDELEKTNERLRKSQQQIIQMERLSLVGQITLAVANELESPLSIIEGFAKLMQSVQIPDDIKQYLDVITNETGRAESILAHVREFHKSEAATKTLLDFSELVEYNLKLALGRQLTSEKNVVTSLAVEKLPVHGKGDQLNHALQQIFRLIGDEFINLGFWRWEVRTEKENNLARLTITAHRAGKSNEIEKLSKKLNKIFTNDKTTRRLPIVVADEIIKYHKGEVGFVVTANGDPSLFIRLPLLMEEKQQ